MATVKEMMGDIGKKGIIDLGGLKIIVEVLDVKVSYAKQRWLVKPEAGEGEIWVESVILGTV